MTIGGNPFFLPPGYGPVIAPRPNTPLVQPGLLPPLPAQGNPSTAPGVDYTDGYMASLFTATAAASTETDATEPAAATTSENTDLPEPFGLSFWENQDLWGLPYEGSGWGTWPWYPGGGVGGWGWSPEVWIPYEEEEAGNTTTETEGTTAGQGEASPAGMQEALDRAPRSMPLMPGMSRGGTVRQALDRADRQMASIQKKMFGD